MKRTREEMLARARGLEWAANKCRDNGWSTVARWLAHDFKREARRLRKAAKEMEKR